MKEETFLVFPDCINEKLFGFNDANKIYLKEMKGVYTSWSDFEIQDSDNRGQGKTKRIHLCSACMGFSGGIYYESRYYYLYPSSDSGEYAFNTISRKNHVDWWNDDQFKEDENLREQLAQQYKIHLMPRDEKHAVEIMRILSAEFHTNRELCNKTSMFKIYEGSVKLVSEMMEDVNPLIVIYPSDGKENAEWVKDKICEMFKDVEGLNKCPRGNKQVTSLIYYSQSDGDAKKSSRTKTFFSGGGVHFKWSFIKSGEKRDFSLSTSSCLKMFLQDEEEETKIVGWKDHWLFRKNRWLIISLIIFIILLIVCVIKFI